MALENERTGNSDMNALSSGSRERADREQLVRGILGEFSLIFTPHSLTSVNIATTVIVLK